MGILDKIKQMVMGGSPLKQTGQAMGQAGAARGFVSDGSGFQRMPDGRALINNRMVVPQGIQEDDPRLPDMISSQRAAFTGNQLNPLTNPLDEGLQWARPQAGEIYPNETPWLPHGISGPLSQTTRQPIQPRGILDYLSGGW